MQTKLISLARLKLLLCGAMFAVSLYEFAQQAETQFSLPAVNLMDINLLDISGLMIGLGGYCFSATVREKASLSMESVAIKTIWCRVITNPASSSIAPQFLPRHRICR